MGDGEAYHRAIGQFDGALHQSFAKGAPADDGATVVVLDGSADNLGGRGSELVDQHIYLALGETAIATRLVLHTVHTAPLGIDDELVVRQKLVGNINGGLEIAATVVLKVEHKVGHALLLEPLHAVHELAVGGGTEIAYADVAHAGTNHINGIDALDGYLVALDFEGEHAADTLAHNAQANHGATGTTQPLHDVFFLHLDTGNGRVVDQHDAVARHDAHLL